MKIQTLRYVTLPMLPQELQAEAMPIIKLMQEDTDAHCVDCVQDALQLFWMSGDVLDFAQMEDEEATSPLAEWMRENDVRLWVLDSE